MVRFEDKLSQALWELRRGEFPAIDVGLLDGASVKRPPNVSLAIEMLESLEMVEARDVIDSRVARSPDAMREVQRTLAHTLANFLIRAGVVDLEVGGPTHPSGKIEVRARVRVMKVAAEKR